MHGIEVVYQSLHSLIGGIVGLAQCVVIGEFCDILVCLALDAKGLGDLGFTLLVLLGHIDLRIDVLFFPQLLDGLLDIVLLAGHCGDGQSGSFGKVGRINTAEGLGDALGYCIVKVGDGLAAVLIVLVGLNGDTSQSGVGHNVVGLTQKAVTVGEAVFKESVQIDLAASSGKGIEIEEKLFSIYTAIGGCSPAFAYMFIDSLARGAVKNGMTKDAALKVAAQAVLGSAKMILESNEHPWKLVDAVCSPGGTTIEGVASLQEDGFEASVISAVEASFNKDKSL